MLGEAQAKAVGIDLGVKNLATTSEGEFIEHPKFLQRLEKGLKREQKKLSRKEKGSNNRKKQRRIVAKIHERIKNARRDFLHKLSRHLINNYDHISFEDLDIKGLIQNSNLAKLIIDAGLGTLITFACGEGSGGVSLQEGTSQPGGGLLITGGIVKVKDNVFKRNGANGRASALSVKNSSKVEIISNIF